MNLGKKALSTLLASYAIACVQSVPDGQICHNDLDCEGNLDCVRVGVFKHICAPVSCAAGAGQAVLDSGFELENYLSDIRQKAKMTDNDFLNFREEHEEGLFKALETTAPPVEVFNSNYTNCLYPGESDRRRLEVGNVEYGLYFNAAAILSYSTKALWGQFPNQVNHGPYQGVHYQNVAKDFGLMGGGDFGLDTIFRIYQEKVQRLPDLETLLENQNLTLEEARQAGAPLIMRYNFDWIPVLTAGPLGVSVGWCEGFVPNGPTIWWCPGDTVEVSLGASLGLGLMGYKRSWEAMTIYWG